MLFYPRLLFFVLIIIVNLLTVLHIAALRLQIDESGELSYDYYFSDQTTNFSFGDY